MKKIILVIVTVFILFSLLILPASAAVGVEFNGQTNLIQTPGIDNISTADFVPYPGAAAIENQPFFKVDLKPNTTYSFISTGGGTDRLLIAPVVNVDGDNTVYGFDSWNLSRLNEYSGTTSDYYFETYLYESNIPGSYTFSFTNNSGTDLINGSVGVGYYGTMYIEKRNFGRVPDGESKFVTFTVTQSDIDKGYNRIIFRPFYQSTSGSVSVSVDTIKLFLTDSNLEYIPHYSTPFFIDNNLSLVSFTTPSRLTGQYVLGLKDPLEPDAADSYFSRLTSEGNSFYLIEGDYTYTDVVDNITSQIGEEKYNEGYSEGYRLGEYEGASSGNIFSNVLMTIFSAPMTIINNTLNFEILGVNVLMLVRIILTILLIAFVITHLKGRE